MGTCMQVLRRLTEYLSGTLSAEEARLMRVHLASCKVCRLVHNSARRTLHAHFPQPERRRTAA